LTIADLPPRQRETYEAVNAHVKQHGATIKEACKRLGLCRATYINAQRRLAIGPAARWSQPNGGHIVPPDHGQIVATDAEAFSCDDEDELPW
jgi:hypothetical protein